jgi:hypothetical protein
MLQVAPLATPPESVYALLASAGRRMSRAELCATAAASGIVALAASALGRASWILLAGCYVVWCFSGWAILFRSPAPQRSAAWRALQVVVVGSATCVSAALFIGAFFWALGPSWKL